MNTISTIVNENTMLFTPQRLNMASSIEKHTWHLTGENKETVL